MIDAVPKLDITALPDSLKFMTRRTCSDITERKAILSDDAKETARKSVFEILANLPVVANCCEKNLSGRPIRFNDVTLVLGPACQFYEIRLRSDGTHRSEYKSPEFTIMPNYSGAPIKHGCTFVGQDEIRVRFEHEGISFLLEV